MHSKDYFSCFIEAQSVVGESYSNACNKARQNLQSVDFANHLYPKTMRMLWRLILYSVCISIILNPSSSMIRRVFPNADPNLSKFFPGLLVSSLILFIGVLVILEGPNRLFSLLRKAGFITNILPILRFIHIFVIIPASIIVLSKTINWLDTGIYHSYGLLSTIGTIVFINIFVYAIGFDSLIIFLMIPDFVLIVMARVIQVGTSEFFPSYDRIIQETINQSHKYIEYWEEDLIEQIRNISAVKVNSLETQVQTISPIFGTIGLLGLVALIASQDQISSLLGYAESWIAKTTGFPSSGFASVLATVMLLALVFAGCYYFIRIYQALWLLHILQITCDLRIARTQKSKCELRQNHLLSQLLGIDLNSVIAEISNKECEKPGAVW